ncbi:MAG: DNA-directed RNA polymerase subunit omega [Oscillospiraceae bacterium]|nr:DNA-directed RNA polymerase subunit omega [Oscillospiraceae bacterium]
MLRPSINQIAKKNESYYSVVLAVAKRAREIADNLYTSGQTLEEKPVKTAVEEFAGGKYSFIEEQVSDIKE